MQVRPLRQDWPRLALAMGLLLALFLVDVALDRRVVLIGFFALAPLLAGATLPPARTAAVSVCAVAAALLTGLAHGSLGTLDHAVRTCIVASISGAAVYLSITRTRREEALIRVTAIAEVAQKAVLRTLPTAVGRVAFAARYLSAAQEALVGGDLYEVAATPYGVRVVVGDVRGKGLGAVQLAAVVLGAFRHAAFTETDLVAVARSLETAVAREVDLEDFVTAVLVEFHDDGTFLVVNCGHHPPLLLRGPAGELLEALLPAPPLGLESVPAAQAHEWAVGDRLLLYTDGLVEGRDEHGRFLPLQDLAPVAAGDPLEQALDAVVARLLAHVGGRLDDDLALVLAQRAER